MVGGVGINQLWKCQSDISTDHAQSQINLITKRKSSWDFIIYSRANPTFPIVKYRSFLFLFLLPIHYNVNKGCGTTVNDMVLPLFPNTCVYILLLCTLWPYVRLAFPKFVVTDPPTIHTSLLLVRNDSIPWSYIFYEYFPIYSTLFFVFCSNWDACFKLFDLLTTNIQHQGTNFSTTLVRIFEAFTFTKSIEIRGQIKELFKSCLVVKFASDYLSLCRFGEQLKFIRFFW